MRAAIEIRELSVTFATRQGSHSALDRLSLTVMPGTICGFLGPNGAGKTTTLLVLLGFIPPTAGTATLLGADVRQSIARERIGYLPENPDLYGFLSGRELLAFAGRLFGLDRTTLRQRSRTLLEETGLADDADRRIATYSRGMKQRLGLAQALINDPELLILDEPTGGLDPLARLDVRRILAARRDAGKTVFFCSHELSEVESVCARIAFLARGQLGAEGTLASLVPSGQTLERFFIDSVTRREGGER